MLCVCLKTWLNRRKSYFFFFQRKWNEFVLFIYITSNYSTIKCSYCEAGSFFTAFVIGIMNNYDSDTTVSHKTISTALALPSVCCFLSHSLLSNSIYRHGPIKQKSLKHVPPFEELCRFPDCSHRGGNCP